MPVPLPTICATWRSPVAGSVRLLLMLCGAVVGGAMGPTLHAQPPVPPVAGATDSTREVARPKPVIPRFVATGGDTIWLGDPREKVAMYAEFPTDTMIRLPLLAADDADGVLFYLAPEGPIRKIAFVYSDERPVAAILEQHLRSFGPPANQRSASVPDGIRESWSWQDASTYMTFTKFTPDQNSVGAIMVITDLRR